MKQFESNGKKYLAVEVPKGCDKPRIDIVFSVPILSIRNNGLYQMESLPARQWQIIGLCPELSEVDCAGIVEYANDQMVPLAGHWKDYTKEIWEEDVPTALLSLKSLIASLGLDWQRTLILRMK